MATTSTSKLRLLRKASAAPAVVPSQGNPLLGSDVYEGDIMDWNALKGEIFFLAMRAHYGTTADTQFVKYWAASKAAGFRNAAYGFLLPNQSVTAQVDVAAQAVKNIGGFMPGDMGMYADAENPRAWLRLPRNASLPARKRAKVRKDIVKAWHAAMPKATSRMDFLLAYLHGLKDKTGQLPGLYVSPSFLSEVFTDLSPLKDTGLWIAHWNVTKPTVVDPWAANTPQYELWQDKGDAWQVPGINGGKKNKADRDWFPGDLAAFNARFGTPT